MQTLFTVSQLAKRWSYDEQTIRNLEREGTLHRMPNLPGVRFCLEEIEQFETLMALGQEIKNHTPYEWKRMEESNREKDAKIVKLMDKLSKINQLVIGG